MVFIREIDHINYLMVIDEGGDEQILAATDSYPFWVGGDGRDGLGLCGFLDRDTELGVQYGAFCVFSVSETGKGVLVVRAGGRILRRFGIKLGFFEQKKGGPSQKSTENA